VLILAHHRGGFRGDVGASLAIWLVRATPESRTWDMDRRFVARVLTLGGLLAGGSVTAA